ncbi:MAG: class I SAM-dependent methyltransferase [Pseudanabaenales cyanobacterium]|nr:class I SAM-dependent methyltransferase [Pseudanabaenales cyanobacterium]
MTLQRSFSLLPAQLEKEQYDGPVPDKIEIDHPATARLKAKGIAAMGQRSNLHLIAADLSEQTLVNVLNHNEVWVQNAQTVIIAEGLVMYLPSEQVRPLTALYWPFAGPDH